MVKMHNGQQRGLKGKRNATICMPERAVREVLSRSAVQPTKSSVQTVESFHISTKLTEQQSSKLAYLNLAVFAYQMAGETHRISSASLPNSASGIDVSNVIQISSQPALANLSCENGHWDMAETQSFSRNHSSPVPCNSNNLLGDPPADAETSPHSVTGDASPKTERPRNLMITTEFSRTTGTTAKDCDPEHWLPREVQILVTTTFDECFFVTLPKGISPDSIVSKIYNRLNIPVEEQAKWDIFRARGTQPVGPPLNPPNVWKECQAASANETLLIFVILPGERELISSYLDDFLGNPDNEEASPEFTKNSQNIESLFPESGVPGSANAKISEAKTIPRDGEPEVQRTPSVRRESDRNSGLQYPRRSSVDFPPLKIADKDNVARELSSPTSSVDCSESSCSSKSCFEDLSVANNGKSQPDDSSAYGDDETSESSFHTCLPYEDSSSLEERFGKASSTDIKFTRVSQGRHSDVKSWLEDLIDNAFESGVEIFSRSSASFLENMARLDQRKENVSLEALVVFRNNESCSESSGKRMLETDSPLPLSALKRSSKSHSSKVAGSAILEMSEDSKDIHEVDHSLHKTSHEDVKNSYEEKESAMNSYFEAIQSEVPDCFISDSFQVPMEPYLEIKNESREMQKESQVIDHSAQAEFPLQEGFRADRPDIPSANEENTRSSIIAHTDNSERKCKPARFPEKRLSSASWVTRPPVGKVCDESFSSENESGGSLGTSTSKRFDSIKSTSSEGKSKVERAQKGELHPYGETNNTPEAPCIKGSSYHCPEGNQTFSGSNSGVISTQSTNSFRRKKPSECFAWLRGEFIAKGSFGSVFESLNLENNELMAVKEVGIRDEGSCAPRRKSSLQTIEQEIRCLKKFEHPNIVKYLGFEVISDTCYLFMEYVPGGSIASCIAQLGKLECNVVKSFTHQILHGLEYLHRSGALHRDLKAGNVLVDLMGGCKIADFGISKLSSKAYETAENTYMLGTPHTMAPEIVVSCRPKISRYSAKADIWSLGCLVLEMLCGFRAWDGLEGLQIVYQLGIAKRAPHIPPEIQADELANDFLQKCFEFLPSSRPTAKQLMDHPFLVLAPDWTFQKSDLYKYVNHLF